MITTMIFLLIVVISQTYSDIMDSNTSSLTDGDNSTMLFNLSSIVNMTQLYFSHDQLVEKCGTWIRTYPELHNKILKSLDFHNKKLLISYPHNSGIADRLFGITTGFLYSILTWRAFQIASRPGLLSFHDFVDEFNINWVYGDVPEPIRNNLVEDQEVESFPNPDTKTLNCVGAKYRPACEALIRQVDLSQVFGKDIMNVFFTINFGETYNLLRRDNVNSDYLHMLGFTPSNAFGCISNFLLHPKPALFSRIYKQINKLLDPNYIKIGIQIRFGDGWFSESADDAEVKEENYIRYFNCAMEIEKFIKEKQSLGNRALNSNHNNSSSIYKSSKRKSRKLQDNREIIWYLLTDSKKLRKVAREKFGHSKLITEVDVRLEHSSNEHMGNTPVSNDGQSQVSECIHDS